METIDTKHWYAIEKIIDDLKEDQKKALTANKTPLEIAETINCYEEAINQLKGVLENWKIEFGYPNVSNLKYILRY